MRGKTISVFIPDGNPRGIKICDIRDSIVKAIYVPRNKIEVGIKRVELSEPGVYFLFGETDELGKPRLYIGEADPISTRIKQHNSGKDFWNTAICFISEKKNINKAHIKYLENLCHQEAQRINKCQLENGVQPTQSTLNEQEVDFVLSFFDDVKILIAALGFQIFEENKKEKNNLFLCKGKDALAEGEYTEDGMVVFKGSRANLSEAPSIGKWATNIRKALLDKHVTRESNGVYEFLEDHTFNSPSVAAAVVLGRSANGWTEWKDENGATLDKRFRQQT